MVKREHELVPPHRIMSRTEINELTETMGMSISNLPKILVSDPQAKKLEAKAGDVIEISRNDSGNSYKYWRCVVES
ncbi:MAG: DNA-directed RNA polymerase subunit RpoH/Rpb5 C-terminal domain-containing protein [Candidatus Micrarchaeales archaeon]